MLSIGEPTLKKVLKPPEKIRSPIFSQDKSKKIVRGTSNQFSVQKENVLIFPFLLPLSNFLNLDTFLESRLFSLKLVKVSKLHI